ncbi:MAG TPA: FecR domain-containing protein [Chitinophagaceae bacterium]|nr:FecR domain-containing protein [Chitinophagaceae bacterium]
MSGRNTHIDTLLVKYLAGETTAGEAAQVLQWIEASPENAGYFAQYKLIWDEGHKLARKSNTDETAAWQRLRAAETPVIKKMHRAQWLRAAAIIILVCGAAFWGTRFLKRNAGTIAITQPRDTVNKTMPLIIAAAGNKVKVDTLPDSSTVTLNRHASITYPQVFNNASRYVELKGEAFFRVTHNPARPFTVKAGDVLVTVIGTSFNIKTAGDTTAVIVATGIVRVQKKQSTIILHAGEITTILPADSALAKSVIHSNFYRHYFDSTVTIHKPRVVVKQNKPGQGDSAFDINKHPDLIQKLMQDPNKWASILKNYSAAGNDINFCRRVVNSVLDELDNQKIIHRDSVRTFRLNESEFIINDRRQPAQIHQHFKDVFIKEPGYTIYLGDSPKTGRGVFLPRDSL